MKHYLGICLVLVTLAAISFFALRSCANAVDHTVEQIRTAFGEVLKIQPKVTLNERVIVTQTAPIAELAVVTKDELVSLGLSSHLEVLSFQIPLTESKLTGEATYRVKAGFDLREPFVVAIDARTHELRATMPHAKILSVEQIGKLTLHGEDATLNRITDEDREKIVNELLASAKATAEKSSLRDDAERQVSERLKQIMQHNGQSVLIQWDKATIPPPQS